LPSITVESASAVEAAAASDALGRRVEHINDLLDNTTRYYYDGASELAEYDGAGSRSRYYVHGVSYVDERLMMYHDGHEAPYYYVIDRMYDVVGLVDYCGSIIERYCYDGYGRPLIRESAGRGDSDNDTDLDMTDQNAVLAGGFDPRMDVHENGYRNITDWVALLNKRSNWYPAASPTVAQAFSDVDNPYMFQGVPHFAIDTPADATQAVLPLNHHRARFADPITGRWGARDPLEYCHVRGVGVPGSRNLTSNKFRESRDAAELYHYVQSNASVYSDPSGEALFGCPPGSPLPRPDPACSPCGPSNWQPGPTPEAICDGGGHCVASIPDDLNNDMVNPVRDCVLVHECTHCNSFPSGACCNKFLGSLPGSPNLPDECAANTNQLACLAGASCPSGDWNCQQQVFCGICRTDAAADYSCPGPAQGNWTELQRRLQECLDLWDCAGE
jgi:hypothetical protein